MKDRRDRQVRIREQQFLGPAAGRRSHRSEMLVLRQTPQVLAADASQTGDFFFGEELLARLNPNHALTSHPSDA